MDRQPFPVGFFIPNFLPVDPGTFAGARPSGAARRGLEILGKVVHFNSKENAISCDVRVPCSVRCWERSASVGMSVGAAS